MLCSRNHLETVASWVLSDGNAFTGESSRLYLARAMEIAHKDLLDVPGAPAIGLLVDGLPPPMREFAFLRVIAALPPQAREAQVRAAFDYNGLNLDSSIGQVALSPKWRGPSKPKKCVLTPSYSKSKRSA